MRLAGLQIDAVPAFLARVRRTLRGSSRGSVILRTAAVSTLNRVLSVLGSLLTVPLVLHHVGRERYGVWMTAIALSAVFTAADGGVTKGMIAMVAKAHGAGDRALIRKLVASALATTIVFVLVFISVVLVAVRLVDWRWVFNLSDPALEREAAAVIATMCMCYALGFPPTVIREARFGLMEGGSALVWELAGVVGSLVGIVIAVLSGCGLVVIAAAWSGAPVAARFTAAAVYLAGAGRDLIPSWRDTDPRTCRNLVGAGTVFVLFTVTQVLAVQSDQILIARFLGAEAVADYAVVQRLFLQAQVLVTLGLSAQWPAYGEALGRGDLAWIKRHLRQSLIGYALFATIVCGLLGLLCNPILHVWVGGKVIAPTLLVLAMVAYGIVAAVANVFALFYLSVGLHRPLILSQLATAVVLTSVSVFLIPRLGPPGAALAATAGFLLAFVLPGLVLRRRILANLHPAEPRALSGPAEATNRSGNPVRASN
jgi:O-antigen/teichoic acid export membrane protein